MQVKNNTQLPRPQQVLHHPPLFRLIPVKATKSWNSSFTTKETHPGVNVDQPLLVYTSSKFQGQERKVIKVLSSLHLGACLGQSPSRHSRISLGTGSNACLGCPESSHPPLTCNQPKPARVHSSISSPVFGCLCCCENSLWQLAEFWALCLALHIKCHWFLSSLRRWQW